MSAEPRRTKAYSPDLRWRIVWQHIGKCVNYRDIAANLSVLLGTVTNVMKLFDTTGSVDPKVQTNARKLQKLGNCHELYILGLIYNK